MQTVFEAAGGAEALLRLAGAWHARVMDDEVVTWATTTTMSRYHRSADPVPDGLRIPHWPWDGLVSESSPDDR